MASSKSSTSAEPVGALLAHLRKALAARVPEGARIAVALSGGVDSVVLLDALHSLREPEGFSLSALHVNHGLQADAPRWAEFCATLCAARDVPFTAATLAVQAAPRQSLEAAARAARYSALLAADADVVALAHHADDQAETFLLQALRGAGPHGLAGMPAWREGSPALWRPFLDLTRSDLQAYAAARALPWVDDPSNADIALRRNLLRHAVLPRLEASFPGARETLARSSRLSAEAAFLLDELAREDAHRTGFLDDPRCRVLRELGTERAGNLLRWYLRQQGLPLPSSARLAAMLAQLATPRVDARIRLPHAGVEIGVSRDRLCIHLPAPDAFCVRWDGSPEIAFPQGTLHWSRTLGSGLSAARLEGQNVTLRSRSGGERLREHPGGPRRSLKNLFQAAGIPPWARDVLPLVFVGDRLAGVPGVAVDVEFAAPQGEPGWHLEWRPRAPRGASA
jgi:tRNA(Ile)-lysidine synthase